jgi:catechol 2,3-dioxygenase-like lactoylglutathione lyase family enzyme
MASGIVDKGERIQRESAMARVMTQKSTKSPLLDIKLISHGTLDCADLQASRRFYEEVLGFEVIQHAPIAMTIRLGSHHTYVVVETGKVQEMNFMNHNGLDVETRQEVDRAYELLQSVKDDYGVRQLTPPKLQHGAYSFYFRDLDNNWWEILANAPDGYSALFARPEVDLTGLSAEELAKHPNFNEVLSDA